MCQANHGLQSFLLYGNPIARDCLENGTRQRETQDGSRRKKSDERESEGGFGAATCLFSETDSYLSPAYGVAMSKEDQRKRQLGDRLSTTTTPTESAMKELLREMTALILAGSYQAALLLLSHPSCNPSGVVSRFGGWKVESVNSLDFAQGLFPS